MFGVESEAVAVRDAERNLRDLPQARFARGRVENALDHFDIERADLVVVDPPRAGLGRDVVDRLVTLAGQPDRLRLLRPGHPRPRPRLVRASRATASRTCAPSTHSR